ncbi:MAG: hypothetical protein C4527_10455 [Candidatus Omnitrophota bacterium]|jgi:hypothetical protein|nr:MAG: hypothetical protein C4527_10455 [Candidatus Omnitrophota bacterium]
MTEIKHKPPKRKWISYTFGQEIPPLEPFDLDPVSDIPIRLAVEEGVIKKTGDLALYRTTADWNEHPKGSIVIAGLIETGKPFALWIGKSFNRGQSTSDTMADDDESETDEADQTMETAEKS